MSGASITSVGQSGLTRLKECVSVKTSSRSAAQSCVWGILVNEVIGLSIVKYVGWVMFVLVQTKPS